MRAATVWQGRRPPLQWRSPNPRRAGVVYDADVVAWDAAVVAAGGAAATASRKALLTTLVEGLKADGAWTVLDGLLLYAIENVTQSRVDLRDPTRVSTHNGSLVFTADRGIAGDGSTAYILTGFNPTTASSPNYVRNSNHKGAWVRTASTLGTYRPNICQDDGNYDYLQSRYDGTNAGFPCNAAADAQVAHGGNTTGHFSTDRSASNLTTLRRNGSSLGTSASASAALSNTQISMLAYYNGGSKDDSQISAAHFGGSLGGTLATAIYTRLAAYMTAVGA